MEVSCRELHLLFASTVLQDVELQHSKNHSCSCQTEIQELQMLEHDCARVHRTKVELVVACFAQSGKWASVNR